MAQVVVRNLPDEVKERLKRRAKLHGHSLEAEVRDILKQVPDKEPEAMSGAVWVAQLVKDIKSIGVTKADIDDLNESIAELRRDKRMREIDPAP